MPVFNRRLKRRAQIDEQGVQMTDALMMPFQKKLPLVFIASQIIFLLPKLIRVGDLGTGNTKRPSLTLCKKVPAITHPREDLPGQPSDGAFSVVPRSLNTPACCVYAIVEVTSGHTSDSFERIQ